MLDLGVLVTVVYRDGWWSRLNPLRPTEVGARRGHCTCEETPGLYLRPRRRLCNGRWRRGALHLHIVGLGAGALEWLRRLGDECVIVLGDGLGGLRDTAGQCVQVIVELLRRVAQLTALRRGDGESCNSLMLLEEVVSTVVGLIPCLERVTGLLPLGGGVVGDRVAIGHDVGIGRNASQSPRCSR